jgi:hypothetical protein
VVLNINCGIKVVERVDPETDPAPCQPLSASGLLRGYPFLRGRFVHDLREKLGQFAQEVVPEQPGFLLEIINLVGAKRLLQALRLNGLALARADPRLELVLLPAAPKPLRQRLKTG